MVQLLMMICIVLCQYKSKVVMLTSEVMQSKLSAISISDHHTTFLSICDRLQALDQLRIVQRLARPIPLSQKRALMTEVNASLTVIGQGMAEVQRFSSHFRGRQGVQVGDQYVTASSWKNGVRRVQVRLTCFYEERLRHFQMVNMHMDLGVTVVRLEEKEWARNCLSRMGPFCICG